MAGYHMISVQISDLSLVRKHTSIGFCPEVAEVPVAFVESGELIL